MSEFYIPEDISELLDRIEKAGGEAYLVGGCVRDFLRGAKPGDYDIATSLLPERIKGLFSDKKTVDTGTKHGTVTICTGRREAEVTTFRRDSQYSDLRHPDSVSFTGSICEDLSRRDFTVNAIAYSGRGEIIDPFCGKDDLNSGILRAVGDPEKRFSEDALRIMRCLRFASVLGFEIEEATADALIELSYLLRAVSVQRLSSELKKLICGKNAVEVLLRYGKVLCEVIPELQPMIGFDQHNLHHIYDVYTHSVMTMQGVSPNVTLRLSALLHDIGKPGCFTRGDDGTGHFYGHAAAGAEFSRIILERLRFDTYTKELICTLVRCHDMQTEQTEKAVKRALSKLTPEVFFMLLELKAADCSAQAPEFRGRTEEYERLRTIAVDILSRSPCLDRKSLAVNGNDLIELGIKDGREIGRYLDLLLSAVIDGDAKNTKESLLRYLGLKI